MSAQIAERLNGVRERLAAVGRPDVKIIAVSKTFPADTVVAALQAGVADLGESYAQELVAKHALVGEAIPSNAVDEPTWHFIGGLQRNKVRKIAGVVDLWHSVDRLSLAKEIAKHSPGARILVQVDISGEDTKNGCAPDAVGELVDAALTEGLRVEGLMGIAVRSDPAAARPGFRLLRGLADAHGLAEVSMGMSADLEIAAEEGSTMIRVGSALFGPRT